MSEVREDLEVVVETEVGVEIAEPEEIDIKELGAEVIDKMSDEERAVIRRDCHTLHFVKLLKLESQRADRMVAGNESRVSYKPVGVVLRTDIDIEVPDIPGEYDKDTGIPAEEIKKREIKAGEEFYLTYYEFMFLMMRPEYGGFCTRDSEIDDKHDPYGVYLSVKMPKYITSEAKLPTPTINFRLPGSPKETMDAVDYYDEDDRVWKIKPEYEWKFGSYIKTVKLSRKPLSGKDYPTSTNAALGLAAELKKKYNYENI